MIPKENQMNDEAHEIVVNMIEKTLKFLDDELPRRTDYSHINFCINVLTATLATIAHNFVREKDQESFINNLATTLRANFEANRMHK